MAKKLILLLSLLFGAFAFADAKDGDIQYLVVAEKNYCCPIKLGKSYFPSVTCCK